MDWSQFDDFLANKFADLKSSTEDTTDRARQELEEFRDKLQEQLDKVNEQLEQMNK